MFHDFYKLLDHLMEINGQFQNSEYFGFKSFIHYMIYGIIYMQPSAVYPGLGLVY